MNIKVTKTYEVTFSENEISVLRSAENILSTLVSEMVQNDCESATAMPKYDEGITVYTRDDLHTVTDILSTIERVNSIK